MSIDILGSLFFSIILSGIFIYLIVQYWIKIQSTDSNYKFLMWSLRCISLLGLIFLLINPWFQWENRVNTNQELTVYIDNSVSMGKLLDESKITFKSIESTFDQFSSFNNTNVKWNLFGVDVRKRTFSEFATFNDSVTDFESLSRPLSLESAHHSFIITDGQINSGKSLNNIDVKTSSTIHILGVGADQKEDDLFINKLQFNDNVFLDDTIKISLEIGYLLSAEINTNILIHSDNKLIYSDKISIGYGEGFIETQLNLPASEITSFAKLSIEPIASESDKQNNRKSFQIDILTEENNILIISGNLSINTKEILTIIGSIENQTTTHWIKNNLNQWDREFLKEIVTYRMIIFDNFPINYSDQILFDQIQHTINENTSIVYIEGPGSNANSQQMLFGFFESEYKIHEDKIEKGFQNAIKHPIISQYDVSRIPPSNQINSWIVDEDKIILKFNDGIPAIIKNNNAVAILIPDLHEIILKEKASKGNSKLESMLIDYIEHLYLKDKDLLDLKIESIDHYKNENIDYTMFLSDIYSNANLSIQISKQDKIISIMAIPDRMNDNILSSSLNLGDSGEYTVTAFAEFEDGSMIKSPTRFVNILANQPENLHLFENKLALMNFANRIDGTYSEIEYLDSLLNRLNFDPISTIKEFKFSALSLQSFWWVLILLFSIEWFFRKKTGLL